MTTIVFSANNFFPSLEFSEIHQSTSTVTQTHINRFVFYFRTCMFQVHQVLVIATTSGSKWQGLRHVYARLFSTVKAHAICSTSWMAAIKPCSSRSAPDQRPVVFHIQAHLGMHRRRKWNSTQTGLVSLSSLHRKIKGKPLLSVLQLIIWKFSSWNFPDTQSYQLSLAWVWWAHPSMMLAFFQPVITF